MLLFEFYFILYLHKGIKEKVLFLYYYIYSQNFTLGYEEIAMNYFADHINLLYKFLVSHTCHE